MCAGGLARTLRQEEQLGCSSLRAARAWPRSFTRSFSLSSSHSFQERCCVGFHFSSFHVLALLFTPSFSLTHTRTHTHLYPPFICIARDFKLITIQMKMRIFHLKSRVCPLPGEIINDKHTHEAVILFFFFKFSSVSV